jgi:protein SCO1
MIDRLTRAALAAMIAVAPLPAFGQITDLSQPARLVPPDVLLIDQDGLSHNLVRDLIRGKIAVVSFVFTGCTTICSPVGANMGALDRLLGAEVGPEVSLISVTLDPVNDTPERLSAWRRQFDDGPGWLLLTGDPNSVGRLLHAMRQDVADIAQHDAFLWLGDPRAGSWTRVSSLASPDSLAALIRHMEGQ